MINNINMLALFVIFYFVAHTFKGIFADEEEIKIIKTSYELNKKFANDNICKKEELLVKILKYSNDKYLSQSEQELIQNQGSNAMYELEVEFGPEIEQNQTSVEVSYQKMSIFVNTVLEYCGEDVKWSLINLSAELKLQKKADNSIDEKINEQDFIKFVKRKLSIIIYKDVNNYQKIAQPGNNSENFYTKNQKYTVSFKRFPRLLMVFEYNLKRNELISCVASMVANGLIYNTNTSYLDNPKSTKILEIYVGLLKTTIDNTNSMSSIKKELEDNGLLKTTIDNTNSMSSIKKELEDNKTMQDYIKKYKDDPDNLPTPKCFCIDLSIGISYIKNK